MTTALPDPDVEPNGEEPAEFIDPTFEPVTEPEDPDDGSEQVSAPADGPSARRP